MAMASLVTSVLALVLAAIILGGLIGVISLVLAIVALRRSSDTGKGKGLALVAMALSLFAMLAALVATGFWVVQFNTGEEFAIDGIVSTSTNLEMPPQEDLDEIVCSTSDGGGSALAIITVTNRSSGPSNYVIEVAWDSEGGEEVTDSIQFDETLPTSESRTVRLLAPRGTDVDPDSLSLIHI